MSLPFSLSLTGFGSWLLNGFKAKSPVGIQVTIPLSLANLPNHPTPEPAMSISITTVLAEIEAAAALLPQAIALVQAAQKAFPNATVDTVLGEVATALQNGYNLEQKIEGSFSGVWSLLSPLVTAAIGAAKAL